MVAIVSGNGLGLLDNSATVLGQRGVFGTAGQGKTGEGVYLNAANGNLILQGRDVYLAARGLDVAMVRTYNAQGKFTDDNGDNWKLGLVKQVKQLTGTVNTANSTITRVEGDGSETVYTYDAARGLYRSTSGSGSYDTLAYSNTRWTWTDGDSGNTEVYDWKQNGRIVASSDLNRNTISYFYNAAGLLSTVADASGESTFFDYAGNNLTQIRSVIDKGNGPR
ncbi:MAG TPA: hypothetical protein VF427_05750, partial [Noviherbaspirillum sp.]